MTLLETIDTENYSEVDGTNSQIEGGAIVDFEFDGNTYQETTTGKNLFDKDNANAINLYVNNTTNKLVETTEGTGCFYIPCEANTTYTVSKTKLFGNDRFCVFDTARIPTAGDTILSFVGSRSGADTNTSYTITTTATATYLGVFVKAGANPNKTMQEIAETIQIEKNSSATSYEKYTGGNPAPNPDYPQEIEVVTGTNTIKVTGKNLAKSYVNGESLYRYAHSLYVDADFEVGKKYAISFVDKSVGNSYYRNEYLMQNFPSYSITATGERQTYYFECKSNDKTESNLYVEGKGFDIFKNNAVLEQLPQFEDIQIEEVTSYDIPSTPYEPYQSQTYSLNLGSIELCKIGTYKDRIYPLNGKWYLEKKIGKLVLNGTENWDYQSQFPRFKLNISPIPLNNSDLFCSHYIKGQTADTNNVCSLASGSGYSQFLVHDERFSTKETYNTWLSSNNVSLYYNLATPTTTEITDATLVGQLDALRSVTLYDGINNISLTSNGLLGSYKIYYTSWYKFEKIVISGYNIKEDRDRITQKFANGHRKQFVSDYTDCIININLDTIDKDTTKEYLDRLRTGTYKYYSLNDKQYKKTEFIIEEKPELIVESSINNNADVESYQVTLLKAGD